MLPPLFARPPVDTAEERRIRRLAAARHAPASWLQRARIITLSWDGVQIRQIAAQLGCHPRTVYRWLHRFNQGGIDDLDDLPARAGPGGCRNWSAARSSRWRAATHRGGCADSPPTAPTAASALTKPGPRRRWRTGRLMRSPTPPRPRGSWSAAARSAGSCWPRGALAHGPLLEPQRRPRGCRRQAHGWRVWWPTPRSCRASPWRPPTYRPSRPPNASLRSSPAPAGRPTDCTDCRLSHSFDLSPQTGWPPPSRSGRLIHHPYQPMLAAPFNPHLISKRQTRLGEARTRTAEWAFEPLPR
jgi:hypothetical protein